MGAAVTAHDAGRRAAHERGRRALERQEPRLEPLAEEVVAPRPVAPHHTVTRHDHGHRVRSERVADGARRARVPDPIGDVGIRGDIPERNLTRFVQHPSLEVRHAGQIHRDGEERTPAREVFGELPPRLLGDAPRRSRCPPAAV